MGSRRHLQRIRASRNNPDFPLTVYYAFKQSESEDDEEGLQPLPSLDWMGNHA